MAADFVAGVAGSGDTGEGEDAWRTCVLCTEESGEGREVV